MVTTRQAVDAVARHIGINPPRVAAVARRLTEDGTIPSGAPKTPPVLDPNHVISIIIGCALDTPLRAVADGVRAYRELAPGGAKLAGAPVALRAAGDFFDIWADVAVHGDADLLRRDKIEIVSSWPEMALHEASGVKRWQPPGSLANHWQAAGHRKSVVLNGAAVVDCLKELFLGGTP